MVWISVGYCHTASQPEQSRCGTQIRITVGYTDREIYRQRDIQIDRYIDREIHR